MIVRTNSKNHKNGINEERLLRIHKLHLGLYARVADDLGISPSYVSLVANGMRRSAQVRRVLAQEIAKIHASLR
jgi:DNA-binding transcriptional regulator YdaS (Cro superfamily)